MGDEEMAERVTSILSSHLREPFVSAAEKE